MIEICGKLDKSNTELQCNILFVLFYQTSSDSYHIYIYISKVGEGNTKAPFSIYITPKCRGGDTPSPGMLHFTLDTYFVMLIVKQGGIKNHFLSL